MKTADELKKDIVNITMKIQQEYPELSKYITEMPVKISDKNNEEINIKNLQDYHSSLAAVLQNYSKTHTAMKAKKDAEQTNLSKYPLYPDSEDIYNHGKKETDLNPEDLSKNKTPNEEEGTLNEKNFQDDMSGNDLDVPGAELDDLQESVGSEDEENNYYSLGGDDHNDLDEDDAGTKLNN